MLDSNEEKRNEALKAMIRMLVIDAVIMTAVVAVFLATGNYTYVIGGLFGWTIIVASMFIGWYREHWPAMQADIKKGDGHDR